MSAHAISYYPLFLDLSGKTCVVVGGGRVAERKVRTLLACGAHVRIVSPDVCKGVRALHKAKRINLTERVYTPSDLKGATLVFATTNDVPTNKRVSQDARRKGILVNIADSPDLCDFIVPAVVTQGSVIIAISTSGTLPMLARKLREEIERQLSKDLSRYAVKVGRLRKLLMERIGDHKKRRRILKDLSKMDIAEIAAMSMKQLRARFLSTRNR
jgi:siroheme synthase-like protein